MRKLLFIILASMILLSSCQEGIITDNVYTVTFSYNDTNRPRHDTVQVYGGALLEKPEDPTREGYAFKGWYKAETGTKNWNVFDFSSPITESIMLYAKWEPVWKVTLQLQGAAPDRIVMVEKAIGTLEIPDLIDVFINIDQIEWYVSGSDTRFDGTVAQDLTLYPKATAGYILTTDNTYLVYDYEGLKAWMEAVKTSPSTSCRLFADITLTTENWTPIGNETPFNGLFDAQGHTISGLNVAIDNSSSTLAVGGLFGYLSGTVKNLKLSSVNLVAANNAGTVFLGSIAGYATESAVVEYCEIADIRTIYATTAASSTNLAVGGVVGFAAGAHIEACTFRGNITADNAHIGGIAGRILDTDVIGCVSNGTYSKSSNAGVVSGGLVGNVLDDASSLIASYSRADASYGLIGSRIDPLTGVVNQTNPTLKACYWPETINDAYPGTISDDGAVQFKKDDKYGVGYDTLGPQGAMNGALGEIGSNYRFNYDYSLADKDYPLVISPITNT